MTYLFAVFILTCGLYIMITSDNYIKKIIGLGIFQSSVLIFYISLGKKAYGITPINICKDQECIDNIASNLSSPLPHVLMLTAIVVGFATLSVAIALSIRIKDNFGTLSEEEILEQQQERE